MWVPLNRELMPRLALLAAVLALGPGTVAASSVVEIVVGTGNGTATIGQVTTALSTSDACGAAKGFGNSALGLQGVAASSVPGCGVSFTYAASADVQTLDKWTICAGCS